MILDSTCSFDKRWPRFATLRMDIRAETKPDIVADDRHLPFRDSAFDQIYCDPPHYIRKGPPFILWHDLTFIQKMKAKRALQGRQSMGDFARYGWFQSKAEWMDYLTAVDLEFSKALKVNGELILKLTTGPDTRLIHLVDLELAAHLKLKEDKSRKSNGSKRRNSVHFLTFSPLKELPELTTP